MRLINKELTHDERMLIDYLRGLENYEFHVILDELNDTTNKYAKAIIEIENMKIGSTEEEREREKELIELHRNLSIMAGLKRKLDKLVNTRFMKKG